MRPFCKLTKQHRIACVYAARCAAVLLVDKTALHSVINTNSVYFIFNARTKWRACLLEVPWRLCKQPHQCALVFLYTCITLWILHTCITVHVHPIERVRTYLISKWMWDQRYIRTLWSSIYWCWLKVTLCVHYESRSVTSDVQASESVTTYHSGFPVCAETPEGGIRVSLLTRTKFLQGPFANGPFPWNMLITFTHADRPCFLANAIELCTKQMRNRICVTRPLAVYKTARCSHILPTKTLVRTRYVQFTYFMGRVY